MCSFCSFRFLAWSTIGILTCLFINYNSVIAQAPAIQWEKSYGGSDNDNATCIQPTNNGYIITGSTNSNDGDVSGNHGGLDVWLVEIDSTNAILWEKSLGGTSDDVGNYVIHTKDGGFAVAGYTASNNGDVSGNHGGLSDMWVVKLDSVGNITWQKCLGGSGLDYATAIQQTADGGYIVAGFTTSSDGDVTITHGSGDVWVVKLNDTGSIVWQKTYGGSTLDRANFISLTLDGGYIVAGYTLSNDGDVSGNHGNGDMWILKLNGDGALSWQKCLGGSAYDEAYCVQQTNDSGYIVTGTTASTDGDISGNHGNSDVWVAKLTPTGDTSWEKCFGGSNSDGGNSIIQTFDSGYAVAGYTASNDGDVSGFHGGIGYDYFIFKLNNGGNLKWEKTLGGTNVDKAYSILQSTDSGYAIAGYSQSNDGDVTGNHGGEDYWIVKLSKDSSATSYTIPVNGYNNDVIVYPTITNGAVYIKMSPGYESAQLILSTTLGQYIPLKGELNGLNRKILLDDLPVATYLLQIINKGVVTSYKIVYNR